MREARQWSGGRQTTKLPTASQGPALVVLGRLVCELKGVLTWTPRCWLLR